MYMKREIEYFRTPKDQQDMGSLSFVYRAIRLDEKTKQMELVTGKQESWFGGKTVVDVYTFDNPSILMAAMQELQQRGVARVNAQGTHRRFSHSWDHTYGPGDWIDSMDRKTEKGLVRVELRILSDALAPFTPIVQPIPAPARGR